MEHPFLQVEITNASEARHFIKRLHKHDLLFHFDDSPETIINTRTRERVFTDEECPHVRARVAELFKHLDDPFEEALNYTD